MLAWFKTKLRNWLLEDNVLIFDLDCIVSDKGNQKLVTYHIIGSRSMRLLGVPRSQPESGNRLIGEGQAKDKRHFWKLWKYFSEDDVCWDDGEPFRPV